MAFNVLAGMDYVQEQGEKGRERGQRSRLADLSSQAYGAQGQQRDSLVQQAIGVDPASGIALGDKLQGREDDMKAKAAGAAKYMLGAIDSGNPAQVQGAYRTVRPLLERLGAAQGKVPPPEWDESMLPALHQVIAAASGQGADESKPSQQRYAEWLLANAPEGERDQVMGVLGGYKARPSGAAVQYKTIKGADGREYLVAADPQEVGVQTIGGGSSYGSFAEPQPQGGDQFAFLGDMGITPTSGQRTPERNAQVGGVPNSYHLSDQARDIPPPSTPEQAAKIRQEAAARGLEVIDEGDHWHLEPRNGQQPQQGNPFASRTPEEDAAKVEAAKLSAQLDALPAKLRLEVESELRKTEGKAGIEAGAKIAESSREKSNTLAQYEAGMRGVTEGLAQAETGPIVGRLPALTTEQQIAQGGVAAIAPVLKSLFRTAGEGTFTDKDQDLLMQMIPTRIDTPGSIAWKLQNIDRIVRSKLSTAPQNSAASTQGDQFQGFRVLD